MLIHDYIEEKRAYIMDEHTLIRLAFAYAGVSSNGFKLNRNLKLLVMVVLDESPKPLLINEIIDSIKNKYGLEFTEEEVNNSINFKKGKYIKVYFDKHQNNFSGNIHTVEDKLFSITEEGREKISKNTAKSFNSIINTFICEKNLSISVEKMSDLLSKFIYGTINYNINDLISLCNEKIENISNFVEFKGIEFTNSEKDLINEFLYWDSSKKNKLLHRLISFSIDFCMLTMKRDVNSFKSVFNGKVFYLDSNIIFRFMGVNNERRQQSIKSFVDICKKNNIKLKYTSETLSELNSSIDFHIKHLSQNLNGFENFDNNIMNNFVSKFNNSDDYFELYYKWRSKNKNCNSINDFKHWMKMKLNECLQNFEIDRESEIILLNKKNEITTCISELGKIKYKELSDYNSKILEVDAGNYIFIQHKRAAEKGKDYFTLNNYLITSDQSLVIYDREKRKDKPPIITLPSIWQSLLLKIFGRTDNDYDSFIEFIALRKNIDNLEMEIQLSLLEKIRQSNEIDEIKELALVKINEIIENGFSRFIEDSEVSEEKISVCVADTLENAKDIYEKNVIKNATPSIIKKHYENLLKIKVEKRLRCFNYIVLIKKILKFLIALSLFIFIISSCVNIKNFNINEYIKNNFGVDFNTISILATLVSIILNVICLIISDIFFCNGDSQKLEKKLSKKHKDIFN